MKIETRKYFVPGIFSFISGLVFFFHSLSSSAQQVKENNFGITVGCVISVGTHVNQFGAFIRTYCKFDRFQWNNDIRLSYYLKYPGPKKPHPEFQLSSGVLVAYGKKTQDENLFLGKTGNQTQYINSIGYAYNFYFNNIKTTQQTGTVAFQWNHYYLNLENDLLARPLLDRFRTGAIQFLYQKDNYRFSVSHVMWTGKLGNPVRDPYYPSPAGYLDTTNSVYPFSSNGILSLSAEEIDLNYGQQLRGGVGIDAEQLRHAVQNRFIHDGIFLPKKYRNPNNFHFPMISDTGGQYLFKAGQKIRKPKVYFNSFLNPDLIY